MRRALAAGVEIDDDPARLDLEAIHQYLSIDSYWAEGRDLNSVERAAGSAARVVGLYAGQRQVGFARALSDGVAVAYLADVYVLPEFRGLGLGVELVREMVERGPLAGLRWMLHTRDAHRLYAKFGFSPPDEKYLERPRAAPG